MSTSRVRILFVSAMPNDQQLFHAGRKVRALRERLGPLLEHGQVSLAIEPAARVSHLRRLVERHRPNVLHIVCHGLPSKEPGRRVLALEGRRGRRQNLDVETLHALIEPGKRGIKVVLLEACKSAPIARELIDTCGSGSGLRAVVATRGAINPTASTRFFVSFHEVIANGGTVRDAFLTARRDLELLAPSLWNLPVLLERQQEGGERSDKMMSDKPSARSGQVALCDAPPADLFGIGPSSVDAYVRIPEVLRPRQGFVGRDEILESLDKLWLPERPRGSRPAPVVHVHGPAGIGKTALIARWLELHASCGFVGATRVFAWSFDPLADGPGCGDIRAFLDEALDFFGALEPHRNPGSGESADAGEWLDGLRLARVVARERALLILDGIPLLPHASHEGLHRLTRVLPPGITALVLELARAQRGGCVITTRLSGGLTICGEGVNASEQSASDERASEGELRNVALEGLSPPNARTLLEHCGVIEQGSQLDARATEAEYHPLELELSAKKSRQDTQSARSTPLARLMSAAEGWLTFDEVKELAVELASTADRPAIKSATSWGDLGSPWVEELRELYREGVITLSSEEIQFKHSSMIENHQSTPQKEHGALFDVLTRPLNGVLESEAELPAFRRTIRVGVRVGRVDQAVKLYKERVCQVGAHEYQQSYVSRTLGLVADDLLVLAELFKTDAPESLTELRDGVDESLDAKGAFLFHRAGLGMRHLGCLKAAQHPMQEAFNRYKDAGPDYLEQAATCANDLAEIHAYRGDLQRALDHAQKAVGLAQELKAIAAREPGPEDKNLLRGLLATYLCSATLGHVHDRLGKAESPPREWSGSKSADDAAMVEHPGHHEGEACEAFDRANAAVQEQHRLKQSGKDLRALFSRPGYQYWRFRFSQLVPRFEDWDASQVNHLNDLAEKLRWSRSWCLGDGIARATRAYDAIWRGKLLTYHLRHNQPAPSKLRVDGSVADAALEALFMAVHVLRANQYVWMLPEALDARAELYTVLEDDINAEHDRWEAKLLRRAIGLPAEPVPTDSPAIRTP